jgi:hypothetical protein
LVTLDRATAWESMHDHDNFPKTSLSTACDDIYSSKMLFDTARPPSRPSSLRYLQEHHQSGGPRSTRMSGPRHYGPAHAHIQVLIRFGHAKTIEGQLLRTSLENLRLELGISGSILSPDHDALKAIATTCWIVHAWQFLHEEKITLQDRTAEVSLQRQGDR